MLWLCCAAEKLLFNECLARVATSKLCALPVHEALFQLADPEKKVDASQYGAVPFCKTGKVLCFLFSWGTELQNITPLC